MAVARFMTGADARFVALRAIAFAAVLVLTSAAIAGPTATTIDASARGWASERRQRLYPRSCR